MRYQESNERRRLPGPYPERGGHMGSSGAGMCFVLFFGLPIVGAGIWITLVGLRVVQVDPKSIHVSHWVVVVAGGVLVSIGLLLWSMAILRIREARLHSVIRKNNRGNAALADYPWNTRCYQPPRWRVVVKTAVIAVYLTVFLVGFNWWAFFDHGSFLVKIITGMFDLVAMNVFGGTISGMIRGLRFGNSQITFTQFPYSLQKPLLFHWQAPAGNYRPQTGTFTLRCVAEWSECPGGDDDSKTLVHEEIWSGTWLADPADAVLPGKIYEFSVDLPVNAQPTCLSSAKPIYWEFEVKLKTTWPSFAASYLIPVYES